MSDSATIIRSTRASRIAAVLSLVVIAALIGFFLGRLFRR